jgi:hypothetical protein
MRGKGAKLLNDISNGVIFRLQDCMEVGWQDGKGKEQNSFLLLHPGQTIQRGVYVVAGDENVPPINDRCSNEIEMRRIMEGGECHISFVLVSPSPANDLQMLL